MTNTQHSTIPDCQGMPPGFQSPCGVILEPHGPHPITAEQAVTPTSQDVSRRLDRLTLDARDSAFLIGWLTSLVPAAVDDALDAMEIYRERRADGKPYSWNTDRSPWKVPACDCTGSGIEHQPGCARVAWSHR